MKLTSKYSLAAIIMMLLVSLGIVQGILLAQSSSLTQPITADNVSALNEFFNIGNSENPFRQVEISPDGSLIAASHRNRDRTSDVVIWNTNTLTSSALQGQSPQIALTLTGHSDQISDLAFSADGALLASAAQDNNLIIWDITNNNGQVTGARRTVLSLAGGHNLVFSPVTSTDANGQKVYVLAGLNDADQLRLWTIAGGQGTPVNTNIINIERMSFTPDGTVLVLNGTRGVIRFVGIAPVGATIIATEEPTAVPVPTSTPLPPGFPTPTVAQIQIAEQVFEHGRMLWVQPVGQIWVMMDDPNDSTRGAWIIQQDTFQEGDPETDPSLVPPDGMLQPERGFGKIWRENPNISQGLGWAITPEFGYVSGYEYHPGGTVDAAGQFAAGPGYHIIVGMEQQRFRFNEADSTWQIE